MQDQDVITKEFYGDAARVADFVNGYLFEGVQLVRQEDIRELDSSMFGKIKWFGRWTTRQRYRDIVRRVLLGGTVCHYRCGGARAGTFCHARKGAWI